MQGKISRKAFTLIEVIIVVSIIGLLASISIPIYLGYQLKSKTFEARANIGGIRICQESFKGEYDFYATCTVNPAFLIPVVKQPWDVPIAGDGWTEIGFQPSGNLYYTYEVVVGGLFAPPVPASRGGIAAAKLADNMCIGVAGDLDGNGVNAEFGFSTSIAAIATTGNIIGAVTSDKVLQDIMPREY